MRTPTPLKNTAKKVKRDKRRELTVIYKDAAANTIQGLGNLLSPFAPKNEEGVSNITIVLQEGLKRHPDIDAKITRKYVDLEKTLALHGLYIKEEKDGEVFVETAEKIAAKSTTVERKVGGDPEKPPA